MKKSAFLVSCAVAGLVLGSQAAMADEVKKTETVTTKETKEVKKDASAEEGKAASKDGKHSCGSNGCEGKDKEKKK